MNGSDLGRAVSSAIIGLVLISLVAGAVLGVAGYFSVMWINEHVWINW